MPWKRGNPGCPRCEETNCGCYADIGPNPVLMIELNIATDVFNHVTCYRLEGGIFVPYCEIQAGSFGVSLSGSIAVPLKRICDGANSRLELDIEETYRALEGFSTYKFRDTSQITCANLVDFGTYPYYIEFNKSNNRVTLAAHNKVEHIWAGTMHCEFSRSIKWLPGSYVPIPDSNLGECDPPAQDDDRGGSYSWEIVPGA